MTLDTIDNLKLYADLNPRFGKVVDFISTHKLDELPLGRIDIEGADVYVNVVDSPAKHKSDAKLETHRQMIDIQIPLSSAEEHGWTPLSKLPETEYNEADDISFYDGEADTYVTIMPGQFVIYFPQDAHAPAISATGLRKLIFKVKA